MKNTPKIIVKNRNSRLRRETATPIVILFLSFCVSCSSNPDSETEIYGAAHGRDITAQNYQSSDVSMCAEFSSSNINLTCPGNFVVSKISINRGMSALGCGVISIDPDCQATRLMDGLTPCIGSESCTLEDYKTVMGSPCSSDREKLNYDDRRDGDSDRLRDRDTPNKRKMSVTYACSAPDTNIAYRRLTEQSSTIWGRKSSNAVDGNKSRNWVDGSGSYTNKEPNPWWQVDFRGPHNVSGFTIWTVKGHERKLNHFHVDYLDENENIIASKQYIGTAKEKIDVSLTAGGVYSLKIQLDASDENLSMAEVEVWGYPAAGFECSPLTCSRYDAACGSAFDGCGALLDCGSCGSGYACEENKCVRQCIPKTCADFNVSCGYVYDECGNTLDCGGCNEGESCYQNQCASCVPKTCSEISPSPCGEVDDGCGKQLDCGKCNTATFLVPMSMDKIESWEELAFLAAVPAGMKINHGKPSVLAVPNDAELSEFQLDYLQRFQPGKIYTVGKEGVHDGDTTLNATSLEEATCELGRLWESSDTAVVSDSEDYQKSLSASALAGRLRAPLFFFGGNTISDETLTCLKSIGVRKIISVGANTQVVGKLESSGVTVEEIKNEVAVVSWLEEKGHGVDYFAVCNSYDRTHFFAPKSSLAAPLLAAARNGAVVPLSIASEFNTPCELTLTKERPTGAADSALFNGNKEWKTGTCHVNGRNYQVAISRKYPDNEYFYQANIDLNGNGDFSDSGEFVLKGDTLKFGDKNYLIDVHGRRHFADVRFTYPDADVIKADIQEFHDALGHHPKYMALVGLPDAIPPKLVFDRESTLAADYTDVSYSDVDDDPMIDIALGRIIGESAAISTLAASRSITYEYLVDSSWKNDVLVTGAFDEPREMQKKAFENKGYNVDTIRDSGDIPDKGYSFIVHYDHGTPFSIIRETLGSKYLRPIPPAVVTSLGCSMANITYMNSASSDFGQFGAVKLVKVGVIGFYGNTKNFGGNGNTIRQWTFFKAILYHNATLGEAFLQSLNSQMMVFPRDDDDIYVPIFYGDPGLKIHVPDTVPVIQPAETVVNGNTVTAWAPENVWYYHYQLGGVCHSPELSYTFDAPGLVPISDGCEGGMDSDYSKRNHMGRRFFTKFTVNQQVNSVTEQDGIDVGLGWNYTNPAHQYAPKYLVDEHWDGSSTVYLNLRFHIFDYGTGEFIKSVPKIDFYVD